ncbi:hypothetical protein ACFLZW_00275 [Chloroflexota bacterium]
MKFEHFLYTGILALLLVSCTTLPASQTATAPQNPSALAAPSSTAAKISPTTTAAVDTPTLAPSETETLEAINPESAPSGTPAENTTIPSATPSATPRPPLEPDEWKELPVIPTISASILAIYRRGMEKGKNPQAFSKIGDCGSTPAWFLGDFDRGPEFYSLGEYQHLDGAIRQFQDSFGRTSVAARSGFNTSSLFVTLWTDRSQCDSNETPLECELRVHRPIIAFITLGTNDVWHPEEFEAQMVKIIEYTIENGVIPVISTKADNTEGDHYINATIAQLSYDYDIPLWNYWLAVQALPNQGLQEDGSHLTWGRNFFDDPMVMEKAWPVRNLNALQLLDAIWQKIQNMEN